MRNYASSFLDKSIVIESIKHQYILFFIIGLFCFVIDVSTLWFSKEIVGINVYLSIGIAFIVATYINYLLNIHYVFQNGRHNKVKEVTLFFIAACVSLLITFGSMLLLMEILAMNYIFAKVITVFLVSIFSFSVRKIIIF